MDYVSTYNFTVEREEGCHRIGILLAYDLAHTTTQNKKQLGKENKRHA